MHRKRLIQLIAMTMIFLAGCAGAVETPAIVPTSQPTSTPVNTPTVGLTPVQPTPAGPSPFAHTACAKGVDLTNQTVTLYHLVDPKNELIAPQQAGFEDAAKYVNAHGGICGASLKESFPDATQIYDPIAEFARVTKLSPKPVLVTITDSGHAEELRQEFAKAQVPALGIRIGSAQAMYGYDGQTLGWIFATNPIYPDQLGAFCEYLSQNPQHYPTPVIGYLSGDSSSYGAAAYKPEVIAYCRSKGVRILDKPVYFPDDATDLHAFVKTLVDSGANILYSNSQVNGPALIAKTLLQMGLQQKVRLATVSWGLDESVGLLGAAALGPDGLPATNGDLGSVVLRTRTEIDQPGIQLIEEQADLLQRPLAQRTNLYTLAWSTTDLFVELYIQTGNRVGFDHITGADIKQTLEHIVYAPLGGLMTIDYQGGTRRALTSERIGQLLYLGRDGTHPAGPNNPLLLVNENGQQLPVPMIVPISSFLSTPDLRPGGADVPNLPVPTTALEPLLGRIAYEAGAGDNTSGQMEVYSVNPDGSQQTRLTNNDVPDWGPAFSPDGSQLAFVSSRDGNEEIYVMNADGSGQTRLTDNPASDEVPSWSPDGKQIAFQSDRDGNVELYVINVDGSGLTRLTDNPAVDAGTSWSPDAKKIAFASDRGGNFDVYVMNADGSGVSNLTNDPANDGDPAWSPNGRQIAFNSDRDGNGEVYIMNADGSSPTNLTHNPANDFHAAWSPDGANIAFSTERDSGAEIYIMRADGSDPAALTHDPSNWAYLPSWGR